MQLLLEGKILVEEALKLNHIKINRVFLVRDKTELSKSLTVPEDKISYIDENLMKLISDVQTNQGLAGMNRYETLREIILDVVFFLSFFFKSNCELQ